MGKTGEQRGLCIGDKVMVTCEEQIAYPIDKDEFRQRLCTAVKNAEFKGKKDEWHNTHTCPLRDPATSAEFATSGLGEVMNPKVRFTQSSIPRYCRDIIPHKFVVPLTEQQFLAERRPGVFHRIVEDLATNITGERGHGAFGSDMQHGAALPRKRMVEKLTHLNRQVPAIWESVC